MPESSAQAPHDQVGCTGVEGVRRFAKSQAVVLREWDDTVEILRDPGWTFRCWHGGRMSYKHNRTHAEAR